MKNEIGFKSGNILKIYMKNFLTYESVEIFPQPYLNVVLGPNGTGKSTILLAICIGLGGKSELTGRSKDLTEYIKYGKSSAVIEIVLFVSEGNDVVIKREFNRENKSSWHLDGRVVKEREVLAKVASMNIQVNNLCQFLPQERVKEFSIMNKSQRLISTEKAVGEADLYDQHVSLMKRGKTLSDIKLQCKNKASQLESEKQKNDRLEDQVRNIQLKEELDSKIKEYVSLLAFVRDKQARKLVDDAVRVLGLLEAQLARLNEEEAPFLARQARLSEAIGRCDREALVFSKKLDSINRDVEKIQESYARRALDLTEAEETYRGQREQNERLAAELEKMQTITNVLSNQINEIEPINEEEHRRSIVELTEEVKSFEQRITSVREKIDANTVATNAVNRDLYKCMQSVQQSDRIKAQRLQTLQKFNRAAHSAASWLADNRDKFSGPVHDPLFMQLEIAEAGVRGYFESVVSKADQVAFVCENKLDVAVLKRKADAERWRINILHSKPDDPAGFAPALPSNRIRELGFDGFLKEFVRAPSCVVSYLCRNYAIHNIPFGRDPKLSDVQLPNSMKTRFIGNQRIDTRRSRYDGKASERVSHVRDPALLLFFHDAELILLQRKQQHLLTQRLNGLQSMITQYSNEEKELNHHLEGLRNSLRLKKAYKDPRKELQSRLNHKLEQIANKRSNICDLKSAAARRDSKFKKITDDLQELLAKTKVLDLRGRDVLREAAAVASKKAEIDVEAAQLKLSMEGSTRKRRAKQDEIGKVAEEIRELEKEFLARRKALLNSLNLESSQELSSSVCKNLQNKLAGVSNKASKPPHQVIEELETAIAESKERRDIVAETDRSIMDEYQARAEKIRLLELDLEAVRSSEADEQGRYEEARTHWLPRIRRLTDQINAKFTRFMESVQCAGEVVLESGSDEEDYSSYGLLIRVKFRDAHKLQEFSEFHQSGGERSLITAFYLLSLQTLTPVPFRCVDEINQGMDPRNERKMFTMLVDSASRPNSSQYIFVTPKILPNLPLSRNVAVINTVNSTRSVFCSSERFNRVVTYQRRRSNVHRGARS